MRHADPERDTLECPRCFAQTAGALSMALEPMLQRDRRLPSSEGSPPARGVRSCKRDSHGGRLRAAKR